MSQRKYMMTQALIELPNYIGAVYILHLGRATERRPQVEHLRQLFGKRAICFDATDSRQLGPDDIHAVYERNIHTPRYPFELSHNEIACFMSHRAIWNSIANGDGKAALVLEDDVAIDAGRFEAALNLVNAEHCATAYCRLPEEKHRVSSDLSAAVTQPALPGLGMQAQIVSPSAAMKLLAFTETFDRPVDTTLQMRWLHGVATMELFPAGITEIDQHLGGTTIQRKRRPFTERPAREWNRFWYRKKLRSISAKSALRP